MNIILIMMPPPLPLPDALTWVERAPSPATTHPAEAPAMARAVPRRRSEFASARSCARTALAELRPEWASIAIPRRADGSPRWPDGVVGSISHCDGLHVAAVAFEAHLSALGVDVEPARALPAEVADQVVTREERQALAAAGAIDTVGFSIKEALFKAWWPRTGAWLDFADAHVEARPDGTAHVHLSCSHTSWTHELLEVRWRVDARHVRAAAWIPLRCRRGQRDPIARLRP